MKDIHTFVILAHNESDDLEDCIKSVLNQSVKTNVVIATSTPNEYIMDLASEYSLGLMVNEKKSNKGSDYNFAIASFNTKLVTIAHQDDLYDRNYIKEIIDSYNKNPDASIIFTDNYEIKGTKKIKCSKSLIFRRFFKFPLRFKLFQNKKYFKLRALKYNKSICTSSVTFIKNDEMKKEIFPISYKYLNDWQGFIDLARKKKTKFVYIPKKLVGYRVYPKEFNMEYEKEKLLIYKELLPKWLIRIKRKRLMKKNEKED